MAKSKFSKRQVAGALLLSSTAVGTAASSSASAGNVLTDFLSSTKSKIGNGLNYVREGTKGALGKASKVAGEYVVSGVDKAGEYFKTGVNKIGSWVNDSGVGNTLGYAKNSRVGKLVGKGFSKLGEKISQVDTYKNYISGHEWGIAATVLTFLTTFGIYKAVQKGVSNYKLNKAINYFSQTVKGFEDLKLQFAENNDNLENLDAITPETEINNQKTKLNENIRNLVDNMKRSKDNLSEYDFKTAMITLEDLESNFLYHKDSKLKSVKNINELKEKFENIEEAFCKVARAYQKISPNCINEELERKLSIIEKKISKDYVGLVIDFMEKDKNLGSPFYLNF